VRRRGRTTRSFSTRALAGGILRIDFCISSTVLAALMGHESSTITERRYVHLFDRQRTDEQVRQAMADVTQ
jgi:integrase